MVIQQLKRKLLQEEPKSDDDLLHILRTYATDKMLKPKQLCELIGLKYSNSWPYYKELQSLQDGECKICVINTTKLAVNSDSGTMMTNQSMASKLLQLMQKILHEVPNSETDMVAYLHGYAIDKNVESNLFVCSSTCKICVLDVSKRDMVVANAIITNDCETLKHLTQINVDYDKLSKCYMDLFFDNVSIDSSIQEYIQLLFTNHGFDAQVSSSKSVKPLNIYTCVNYLLEELMTMISNKQLTDLWLIHLTHQLTLIVPYQYKNETVWMQYIYIVRHCIRLAMQNRHFINSPIINKLEKYTMYLTDRRDKAIVCDLEDTYYCKRERYAFKRMQTVLNLVKEVNCRDPVGQLAFLHALQVIGECVKNTTESPNMRETTLATLLTDETAKQIIQCRDALSHCISLPHIDISLLENIKIKLMPLQEIISKKLYQSMELVTTESVHIPNHIGELCRQLRMAPTDQETRLLPISLLREILRDVSLDYFRANVKLSAAVITLVLCIFQAMQGNEKVTKNKCWLLERYPVLLDRQLRNHYAHSGWFQLLPIDETAALYYCARMLLKPNYQDLVLRPINLPDEDEWYQNHKEKKLRLSKTEKLWSDIGSNNISEVESVIKSDVSLLYARRVTDQRHALHFAAEGGKEMIQLILKIEQKMKSPKLAGLVDRYGYSALHLAAKSGNPETCKAVRTCCQTIDARQQCFVECKTALHLAIMTGRIDVVKEILKFSNNGLKLHARNGYHAIHMAVCLNARDIVKLLFEKSGAVCIDDILTDEGHTCLYLAAQQGHVNVLIYLLEIGSDVNRLHNGVAAVHIAAQNNHQSAMQELVNYGAHLNAPKRKLKVEVELSLSFFTISNMDGYNNHEAFWKALQQGHIGKVQQYLNNDAIKLRMCNSNNGKSPLHFAVEGGNIDCLRLMLNKCNINARDFDDKTALHTAADCNNLPAAKLLIEGKANTEIFDTKGFNAVHVAIKKDHREMTHLLIAAHKADLNTIRTKCRRTCLHLACEYGHNNLVKELLLEHKATNAKKLPISNLLLIVVPLENTKLVSLLVKHDADVNFQGKHGETALHLAAEKNNLEICTLLIKHGAYSELRNKDHKTAGDIAKKKGHDNIVIYLENHQQEELQQICQKVKNADLPSIKRYFKSKKSFSVTLIRSSDNEKSLLHCAIESCSKDMVSYVYYKDRSLINVADSQRRTVLHAAAKTNCDKGCPHECIFGIIFKWYMAHHAKTTSHKTLALKLNAKDLHGKVPLQYAIIFKNAHAVKELFSTTLHYFSTKTEIQEITTARAENLCAIESLKYKVNVFWTALKHFDPLIMSQLVSHLGHVNEKLTPNGSTLLHLATNFLCSYSYSSAGGCDHNQFIAFQFLIDTLSCDVNAQTIYKLTPLHIATRKGNLAMVKKLIENGADINALGDYKVFALNLAARYNHVEITRILVDNAANVNETDWQSKSPIYYALRNRNVDIVRILMDGGAFIRSEYRRLEMSSEIAECVEKKGQETIETLPLLWQAVKTGQLEQASYLLQTHQISCMATCDESGSNALHFAAGESSLEMFAHLCKDKQLRNVYHNTDMSGRTVLHIAAGAGNSEIVEHILQKCELVNVNDQDDAGQTAMHVAAAGGRVDIIQKLFDKYAICDIGDKKTGAVPLHLAAHRGHKDVVEILIQRGADIEAIDKRGKTALHFAALVGRPKIVSLLIHHGANVHACDELKSTPLHLAALNGHAQVMQILIQYGANLEAADKCRRVSLHFAAWNGHTEAVEMLIQHEANIEAGNDWRRTPLFFAAASGHSNVVKILIGHEANVHAIDKRRSTPIHFAAANGHTDVVDLLIQHFADVQTMDDRGRTPLHLASLRGHTDTVRSFSLLINKDLYCNKQQQ